jgi:hypothetical protein
MDQIAQNEQQSKTECISEWQINNRGEVVRISLEFYKGAWRVDCRKYYLADDDELHATKQGVSLPAKHLPRLADAFAKALTVARERDIVIAEHEDSK